ncbi:hypothetical protein E2C01_061679 [Portunus trituberculatus]|uniref:Uncharacterized protein n=1 Tax=Portunus trituberculatus TaxID=210409 RepID=A0A5B7H8T8_PORTR|nr:hypothetical protein [Portunus trituberculatus]
MTIHVFSISLDLVLHSPPDLRLSS